MDGKKCGTLPATATPSQLFVDKHMELMPIDYLASEELSFEHDTNGAWVKLHDNRRFARAFFDFSLTERQQDPNKSQTWVGFERNNDRVCGTEATGRVVLPQNALIFFGINNGKPINFTNFLPRLSEGSVILRTHDTYHLTFTKAETSAAPEHVCPQMLRDGSRQHEKGSVRMCFPGEATVTLACGRRVAMKDLRVGDWVKDGSGGSSAVYMFSHRDAEMLAEFVEVGIGAGRTMTASDGHYIQTGHELRMVGLVGEGDRVLTEGGDARVVGTRRVLRRGVYNPQTMSGMIVVDGVVASVYTSAVEVTVAHALLAPVRWVFMRAGNVGAVRRVLEDGMWGGVSKMVGTLLLGDWKFGDWGCVVRVQLDVWFTMLFAKLASRPL